MTVRFTVPALPRRTLSPNSARSRSRRNPWEVSEAKLELGDAAFHAVLETYGADIPVLQPPVVVTLTLFAKHHARPKAGDCPRCLARAFGESKYDGSCICYRATDPSNLGGDVAKPILDAGIVRHGIIPDDDYKHISEVRLRMGHVETLAEERIEVEIEEVGE